jgi:hypothetical protein
VVHAVGEIGLAEEPAAHALIRRELVVQHLDGHGEAVAVRCGVNARHSTAAKQVQKLVLPADDLAEAARSTRSERL